MRPSNGEIALALAGLAANVAVVVSAWWPGLSPFTAEGVGVTWEGVGMLAVSTVGTLLVGLAILLWALRWLWAETPHDGHPGP